MLLGLEIYILIEKGHFISLTIKTVLCMLLGLDIYIYIFIEKGIGKELRNKSCKTLLNLIQLFQASHGQETI